MLQAAWQGRVGSQWQRGIVMSAGGLPTLTNAFITLRVLRAHLNCTLPAAIM